MASARDSLRAVPPSAWALCIAFAALSGCGEQKAKAYPPVECVFLDAKGSDSERLRRELLDYLPRANLEISDSSPAVVEIWLPDARPHRILLVTGLGPLGAQLSLYAPDGEIASLRPLYDELIRSAPVSTYAHRPCDEESTRVVG